MSTVYRLFNHSLREILLVTTDFQQALECWSAGSPEPYHSFWTIYVETANGQKKYLQGEEQILAYAEELIKKEAAMKTYNYTVYAQGEHLESTTLWQKAIDLFNENKEQGSSQIVAQDPATGTLHPMTTMHHIQFWSEHLMNLRYNEQSEKDAEAETKIETHNRVERRLIQEMMEQEMMEQEMMEQEIDGMEIVEPRGNNEETNDKLDFHGDFSEMDKWTQDQIINPKHYKIIPPEAYTKHPEGLEYMDVMGYALSHLSGVEAHTMGHVFKYSFRIGKKDAKLQDAKKIAWYANRMVEILEAEKEDYPDFVEGDFV
jgi:hypothetical protein